MSRSLSPPCIPKTCRLGILGTRNKITSAEITSLLTLIVEDSGPLQAAYLSQEGMSSIYAETYFDANEIPVTALDANWARHGRSAALRRDAEIIQSATNFLVFGGPKSTRLLKIATDLAKKGRTVYYLAHNTLDLELLEVTSLKPHADAALTGHGHKSNKGKGNSQQLTLEQVYS